MASTEKNRLYHNRAEFKYVVLGHKQRITLYWPFEHAEMHVAQVPHMFIPGDSKS